MKYLRTKAEKIALRDNFINDAYTTANGGALSGSPTIANGITLNGSSQYVTYGAYAGIKGVTIDLAATTTTEDILDFDGGTHTLEVGSGTITATGWSSPTIYVNGAASSTLTTARSTITVTTATAFDATAFIVGLVTASYFDGTIYSVTLHREELSAGEASDIYAADTFRELDALKSDTWLDFNSSYDDGSSDRRTPNKGTGIDPLLGDGSTASTFPTIYNSSADFDGNDDYIDLGSDTIGTDLCSWVVAFRADGWGGLNLGRLWDNGQSVCFLDDDAKIRYSNDVGGAEAQTAAGTVVLRRKYILIIVRKAGDVVDIYLDGVLLSGNDSANTPIAGGNVRLGNNSGGVRGFDGLIYTYRHFKEQFTPTQVREITNKLNNQLH